MRCRHEDEFEPKRWIMAMRQKREMPRADFEAIDPGPMAFKNQDGPGVFLGAKGQVMKISAAKNLRPNGSFGFGGTFASLESDQVLLAGTLALRFDPAKLGQWFGIRCGCSGGTIRTGGSHWCMARARARMATTSTGR